MQDLGKSDVVRASSEVVAHLQSKVDGFIAESPFFATWTAGNVSRSAGDRFLLAFDHLVASFPALIALGISRLSEPGRVVLSKNLFEECGEGDAAMTHHAIYRRFLRSAGLSIERSEIDEQTTAWQRGLRDLILSSGGAEVVGGIAAGEVLAQPALGCIFQVIQSLYRDIDVEYFTSHLELEQNHVAELATLIAFECTTEESFGQMVQGFNRALGYWNAWFRAMA